MSEMDLNTAIDNAIGRNSKEFQDFKAKAKELNLRISSVEYFLESNSIPAHAFCIENDQFLYWVPVDERMQLAIHPTRTRKILTSSREPFCEPILVMPSPEIAAGFIPLEKAHIKLRIFWVRYLPALLDTLSIAIFYLRRDIESILTRNEDTDATT